MRNDLPISQDKKFKYSITFQSFDEESLEIGETDDKGYEVEENTDTIGDILYEANTTYGIYMPVSFGYWESTEPKEDTDYFEKGIRKFYALHISNEDGTDISQEENDFITFLLSDGRYEINKFRDYAVGGIVLGTVALGVGASLIAYLYLKEKKETKEVQNNRAKSVTHIIKGKERKFPIKDAWKRERTLENKSEKYEVPQADRKPINFEMGGQTETKMSYEDFVETLQEYEIEGGFGKTLEKGLIMYYLPNDNPYFNTKFNHRNLKKAYKQYLQMKKFANGGVIGSGKNGYIAMYKGKKLEVYADTKYEAQQKAAQHFKAKKSYEVDVYLAELDGKQYITPTDFAEGGRVTTNDGIIEAFLTTNKQLKVGNLSTHFNQYDNQILLRNYGTLIATRKGNDVEITNTKYSKTTTIITNKVRNMALNKRMNVKHVDKFADGGEAGDYFTMKDGSKMSKNEWYQKMEEKMGFEKFAERELKDAQFGRDINAPLNELTHNRLDKKAVIGKNSVTISSYTPNYKRHLDSITFYSVKELNDYLNKNQILADGGGVNEKKYYNNMNRENILSQTVVYDNDGESFDRYTVFTPDGSVFGMSENATGFNQYIGDNTEIEQGNHLGKKLKSVPKGIESAVLDRMIEDTYAKGGGVEKRSLMSVAHLVDWKEEGIKKWYIRSYPKDDLGEQINDANTFKDLWDGLHQKKDVYQIIGVGDSVVRERLFEYLSLIYDVDYSYVYDKWLESDDEYAEGGEVQDWMEEALASLIEKTGYDDLEITIVSDDGNEFIATDDNVEYRVFRTEEDAEEVAVERVREDLEENPEYFNKDFISNYIDGRDFFESALDEMNLGYAEDIKSESDDIYANRLVREMVENGLLDKDDALSDDGEELAEESIDDFVNLMTEGQLDEGNDGLDYFISNFGEKYTMGLVIDNNLIDVDEASKDAVQTDGIGHFLSSYDGETVYLSNDNVAYRVN